MLEYPSVTSMVAGLPLRLDARQPQPPRRRDFTRFPPLLTGTSIDSPAKDSLAFDNGRKPYAGSIAPSFVSPTTLSSTTSQPSFLPEITPASRKRSDSEKRLLLRKPTEDLKSRDSKTDVTSDTCDSLGAMSTPMFSVRACPRYEKPLSTTTSSGASSGGRRTTFETLFPNVKNLLKAELLKEKSIRGPKSSTPKSPSWKTSNSLPSAAAADATPKLPVKDKVNPSQRCTTQKSSVISRTDKPKTIKTPSTPASLSTTLTSGVASSNSGAASDARRRPDTSSRRTKDLRPGSRKGAKSRRKKRKPTTLSHDENNNRNTLHDKARDGRNKHSHQNSYSIADNGANFHPNPRGIGRNSLFDDTQSKSRPGGVPRRSKAGENKSIGEEVTSVVKLLSRKLSGLGLYKNGSRRPSGSSSTGEEEWKGGRRLSGGKVTGNDWSRRETGNSLAVVGKRGKMETKSLAVPSLSSLSRSFPASNQNHIKEPKTPPTQPIIFGKFVSSFSLSASLAASTGAADAWGVDKSKGEEGEGGLSSTYPGARTIGAGNGGKEKIENDPSLTATTAPTTFTTKKGNEKGNNGAGGKAVKIYLSHKQTCDVRLEGGVSLPGAPPATPRDSYAKYVDYVPAMSDIRSQRQLRNTLASLEQKQKAKAERLLMAAKDADAERRKEAALRLKTTQRREIYILNEIMEELENQNFRQFCRNKGIDVEL